MTIFAPSFFKLSDADYIPKRREISGVTNALEATVTTTADHGYSLLQLVRLHVPPAYGMQLDGILATVLTIPSTTSFTVDMDTTQLATYVIPTEPPAFTNSHVVPVDGVVNNIAT